MYNSSHGQSHQPYNAAQTFRTNISSPQATNVQFYSGLNYEGHNITSSATSLSRSRLDDPPPSYDECMASSRPTPYIINLPTI